jgi:DNA-binding FadR family transcriptional regulator
MRRAGLHERRLSNLFGVQDSTFTEKGGAIVQNEFEHLKEEILAAISGAPDRRLKPHDLDLEKDLSHSLKVSRYTVQNAIRVLAEEGQLVYTYRDPSSYVELPAPNEPARSVA